MTRFFSNCSGLFAVLLTGALPLAATVPLWAQEAPETATAAPPPAKGFRFTSREMPEPSPSDPSPAEPSAEAKPTDPDAGPAGRAMQVGRLDGPETLPPALRELARQGALAVADGNWEEAREIYLKMVGAAPDNALSYANLGVAEHQLGNLLAAAGNLAKSLEINPHIARNWQTLGLIRYERGELALAISHLTRAVHEAPEEAETRLLLAAVVRDYGWTEAAVTELQRAVEIDPKLASAHYNLAVTYLEMKPPKLELARRHYYAAVDLGTPPAPEVEAIFEKSGQASP